MQQSTPSAPLRRGTPHASLAALGLKLEQLDLFAPVRQQVQIPQKTLVHTPMEKLHLAFVALLAGARGMVEVNRCLRADPALQRAFGHDRCAEQSVVQDTLDACTPATVAQMEGAIDAIFRQHSAASRHDYEREWQLLDVDLTGMPCGRKAALATKGYFGRHRARRGRQLGRVAASRYGEVVVDRLFAGSAQLTTALVPLVQAAANTLALDYRKKRRTVLRVDAGGGSVAQINWALIEGYQFHGKDLSTQKARRLARTVRHWVQDPHDPERQVAWVEVPAQEYVRPVQRIATRCRTKGGRWHVALLVSTLEPKAVLSLLKQDPKAFHTPEAILLSYVTLYDQRGGGAETTIREDKQGLGITQRNKKRFEAQEMLVQLGVLAHNVLVWAKRWLAPFTGALKKFGNKRLVRDALSIRGILEWDRAGCLRRILLNRHDPLSRHLAPALQALLGLHYLAIISGET